MDVDSGISRKLPPMPEENVETPEINKRNIYVVLINKNNKVLAGIGSPTNNIEVDGNGIISESLKEEVKSFVNNNGKKDNSSESPEKQNCFITKPGGYFLQYVYTSTKRINQGI